MVTGAMGSLPAGRSMDVTAADGTHLHAEVFGPEDGYPIVLVHGITSAIEGWCAQIRDLAGDHRVIAFDHRGHGQSEVPPRERYGLDHLASDLEHVLAATLTPGERAVIVGHSMGGIAIMAWAERHQGSVQRRADAVALINTTTGGVIRGADIVPVAGVLADSRVLVLCWLIKTFADLPTFKLAAWNSRQFVRSGFLGSGADPEIARLLYDIYAATPRAGRAGCARMVIDAIEHRHLTLEALTVPTMVISGDTDRLIPGSAARHIAEHLPNLWRMVALPGGHCSILEHPAEVNRLLRQLVESTGGPHRGLQPSAWNGPRRTKGRST